MDEHEIAYAASFFLTSMIFSSPTGVKNNTI